MSIRRNVANRSQLQIECLEPRLPLTVDVSGVLFWDANRNGLNDDPAIAHESVVVSVVGDDDDPAQEITLTGMQAGYMANGIPDETFNPNATIQFNAADVTADPEAGFELTSPLVNVTGTTTSYTTLNNVPVTKPSWVETANLDGINGPDLIVANFSQGKLSILLNDGTGTFLPPMEIDVPENGTSIDQADFDDDGDIDLVVGNLNADHLVVLVNDGNGNFDAPGATMSIDSGANGPFSVVARDIDGDGKPDLVSSDFWGQKLSVYLNESSNGQVTFADVDSIDAGSGSRTVVAANLNGQTGAPSAVLLNVATDELLLFDNNGSGEFSFSGTTLPALAADFVISGDLDDDGLDDLTLYSRESQKVFIYFADGSGGIDESSLIDPQTVWFPRGLEIADMDGDGDKDLVANLIDDFGIAILRNEGGRRFSDTLPIFEVPLDPIVASPPALADFNGDGVVDIAYAPKWLDGKIEVDFRQVEEGFHTVRSVDEQMQDHSVTGVDFGIHRIVTTSQTSAGDYDGSGTVDQLDYEVWRANFGTTTGPGMSADGNGDKVVDSADYTIWRNNLGASVPAGALQSGGASATLANSSGGLFLSPSPTANEPSPLAHGNARSATPQQTGGLLFAQLAQDNDLDDSGVTDLAGPALNDSSVADYALTIDEALTSWLGVGLD